MNSGLQPVKVTIPANSEDGVNVAAGRFFAVKEASAGAFSISLDDGAFVPWDSGMAYAVADGAEPFHRLNLRNESDNPITFQIIVGIGRVFDQRLTVVASRVGDSLALDGEDGTGLNPPAGGTGIRGFLSGIYDRLKTTGPLGVLLDGLDTVCTSILTGVAAISGQLPATLGQKTMTNSLAVTVASNQTAVPVSGPLTDAALRASAVVTVQAARTGAIVTVATDGTTGAVWTAFGSQACATLDIFNTTGTAIEYRRNGAGASMPIPDGLSRKIEGITDADEIEVRRVDLSNVSVDVNAEALT